jgi:hypothetical protein
MLKFLQSSINLTRQLYNAFPFPEGEMNIDC